MSNYAANIIKILADLPEFLRKIMLKQRLEEFFNKEREEQLEIIKNAIDAIPEVDSNTLARLIRTWVDTLYRFGDNKMEEMFSLYAYLLSNEPEKISRLDIKGLIEIYNSLEDDIKRKVSNAIRSAVERLDDKEKLLSNIPIEAREAIY